MGSRASPYQCLLSKDIRSLWKQTKKRKKGREKAKCDNTYLVGFPWDLDFYLCAIEIAIPSAFVTIVPRQKYPSVRPHAPSFLGFVLEYICYLHVTTPHALHFSLPSPPTTHIPPDFCSVTQTVVKKCISMFMIPYPPSMARVYLASDE